MDFLFKNVTAVTMREDAPVLYNADIGVKNGKLTFDTQGLTNPRVIAGEYKVLMPGLYNCHDHGAMTLFRGYANDRTLEDWLFNFIFPAERKLTPELVRIGMQLAMAEMIASGTISFTDMYFYMDAAARAVDAAGMMANLSNAVIGFDRDSYDFYKDNVYGQTMNVLDEYHGKGDGRVKAEASIHGVYTSFAPAWKQVMDFAEKYDLGLHVHISETKVENDNCLSTYNTTPTQVFYKHGVLERPTNAAHCVWATEEDIAVLAEKGVSVAHNPVSNLKLASGLAPVKRMLEAGINVTLGTDGMSSNNSHDLFEEIKMASILQKYATGDPTALPAMEVLKMATLNGAKAQGRERESGQITEGFDADVILLDFNTVRQTVCHDAVLNLAYSVTGRDVQLTMCKGKVLYENGEHKTIDIEKLLFEARKAGEVFKI
jgi:5-methylthioadenosine/S-adenosylhomocysteine deaminase